MQSGHILLGEDTFQTVTIVPTETNPGEVSYVLIVQQPDGEGDNKEKEEPEDNDDQDLTIYDFEDNEDPGTTETPVRVITFSVKGTNYWLRKNLSSVLIFLFRNLVKRMINLKSWK